MFFYVFVSWQLEELDFKQNGDSSQICFYNLNKIKTSQLKMIGLIDLDNKQTMNERILFLWFRRMFKFFILDPAQECSGGTGGFSLCGLFVLRQFVWFRSWRGSGFDPDPNRASDLPRRARELPAGSSAHVLFLRLHQNPASSSEPCERPAFIPPAAQNLHRHNKLNSVRFIVWFSQIHLGEDVNLNVVAAGKSLRLTGSSWTCFIFPVDAQRPKPTVQLNFF